MKSVIFITLSSIAAFGQTQPPPAQAPKTTQPPKTPTIEVDVGKQLAAKPDDVVATINGRKITALEMQRIVQAHPAQAQKLYQANPKQFVRDYAMYKLMEEEALKNKLDQESPYKEQLEFARMVTLINAQATHLNVAVQVSPEDERKFYETNRNKYHEAKAKVIYIPFGKPDAGKNVLSESEAKAKAEELVKEARAGADFVKLVKEHSQEPASRQKDGDLGIGIRQDTQQVPESLRKVILATKVGEITDPLRLDNGFYVFRIESSGVLPYEQVRGEIFKELKQAGLVKWQREMRARATVTFDNEEFFQQRTAPKQ